MSNIVASLNTTARSMKAYETALTVVQNNVTNASTVGFARQQTDFVALAFQPELDLPGGVAVDSIISSRSRYAERSVWTQSQKYGRVAQTAAGLSQVEPALDIGEGSGIASAIDEFYSSYSQLSVAPEDVPLRENVIRRAREVARSFNYASDALVGIENNTRREAASLVEQINQLAADIRDINEEYRRDYRKQSDAGLEARLYASLEQLSELADFNVLPAKDGSLTVLIGGEAPLVIGDKVFEISADTTGTRVEILDYSGNPITSQLNEGRLKGLLDFVNDLLPTYSEDLDTLAKTFADRVNQISAQGLDLNGQPPALLPFIYDAANGAAMTLSVSGITAEMITAAEAGTPGGNGNALEMASLTTSEQINGFTFTEYYGQICSRAGDDLLAYEADENTQTLLLSQAKGLRDDKSAVDLNEEAALLLQYQRAYQANAQLLKVLNEITDTLLGMLR